jgi:hypothetical protein
LYVLLLPARPDGFAILARNEGQTVAGIMEQKETRQEHDRCSTRMAQ